MTEGSTEPDRLAVPDQQSNLAIQSGAKYPPAWGPWASLGGTVLGLVFLYGTRLLTVVAFLLVRSLVLPSKELPGINWAGTLNATGTILALPIVLAVVMLMIVTRGWSVVLYLEWRTPTVRAAVLAILCLILGLASALGLALRLDRPIVTATSADAVQGTPFWLVALAVTVAGPVVEEVLFRGFLFRGLADSKVGPGMAIGLSATAWVAYQSLQVVPSSLYALALLYLFGLFLGVVRYLSRSLPLVIFLNALASTAAVAEAVYFAGP